MEERVLEVEIEPGMPDGYEYPFIAEGGGRVFPHEAGQILLTQRTYRGCSKKIAHMTWIRYLAAYLHVVSIVAEEC